jgi:hypothetical protein
MDKTDFKAERKDLYAPASKEFSVVDVPAFDFAMIDGRGDPNTSPAYADAVEALYSISYALKFGSKRELGKDYVVTENHPASAGPATERSGVGAVRSRSGQESN